jgi:transposase
MRHPGNADELLKIRREALMLLDQGIPATDVARRVGRNTRTIRLWKALRRERGKDGLRTKKSGPCCKLPNSPELNQWLKEIARGPRWKIWELQAALEREFFYKCHRSHVPRLLEKKGWHYQPHDWKSPDKPWLARRGVDPATRMAASKRPAKVKEQHLVDRATLVSWDNDEPTWRQFNKKHTDDAP